jgi:hypothetical protein
MMVDAGSMNCNVAKVATLGKPFGANIAPDARFSFRYIPPMMQLHEWVAKAWEHSGLSGAALSRRFWEKLGRVSEDRSIIGKMAKDPATAGTKPRKTSVAELIALSEITGYALPDEVKRLAVTGDDREALEIGRRVVRLDAEQQAILRGLLDQFDPEEPQKQQEHT